MTDPEQYPDSDPKGELDYRFYFGKHPDPASASKFAWQEGNAKVFRTPEEAQAWLDGEDSPAGDS